MDKVRSLVSSLRSWSKSKRGAGLDGGRCLLVMYLGKFSGENAGYMNSRLTVEFVGGIVRFLQKGDCEVEPDAEEGAC